MLYREFGGSDWKSNPNCSDSKSQKHFYDFVGY